MKKSELRKIIKEELVELNEDILTDFKKIASDSFVKFTPASVLGDFISSLQDAYEDGKIKKSYLMRMKKALPAATKRIDKIINN